MAAPRSTDEAEIRRRIDTLFEAIRAMNLDTVMSIYAQDIVSFDIEPPLQHLGAEAGLSGMASSLSAPHRRREQRRRSIWRAAERY